MYTLCRDSDKHPERRRLADGIHLELRDLDDEGRVDFDLDDGDERIQKIRGMRAGQSKLFRGRSGKWYRFRLLDVSVRTEAVRVGVMPG